MWAPAGETATNTQPETVESWLQKALFQDTKPLQQVLYERLFISTANAHVAAFLNDSSVPDSSKSCFRSTSFEHAGKWLVSTPRNGFRMTSREFKTAMQLRLGINNNPQQSACSCGHGNAYDHQHLLNCHVGNQIANRHGAIVNYFCDLLKEAGEHVVKEEKITESFAMADNGPRSDFTIKRRDIGSGTFMHQHYDVTVVNPAAATYLVENKSHQVNGVTAHRAHQQKIRKYANYIDKTNFHPLVFEVYGYWEEDVTQLIKKCCTQIEENSGIPFPILVNYWISRLAFTLQWENAMTITERMDVAGKENIKKKLNSRSQYIQIK